MKDRNEIDDVVNELERIRESINHLTEVISILAVLRTIDSADAPHEFLVEKLWKHIS